MNIKDLYKNFVASPKGYIILSALTVVIFLVSRAIFPPTGLYVIFLIIQILPPLVIIGAIFRAARKVYLKKPIVQIVEKTSLGIRGLKFLLFSALLYFCVSLILVNSIIALEYQNLRSSTANFIENHTEIVKDRIFDEIFTQAENCIKPDGKKTIAWSEENYECRTNIASQLQEIRESNNINWEVFSKNTYFVKVGADKTLVLVGHGYEMHEASNLAKICHWDNSETAWVLSIPSCQLGGTLNLANNEQGYATSVKFIYFWFDSFGDFVMLLLLSIVLFFVVGFIILITLLSSVAVYHFMRRRKS